MKKKKKKKKKKGTNQITSHTTPHTLTPTHTKKKKKKKKLDPSGFEPAIFGYPGQGLNRSATRSLNKVCENK